MNLDVVSESTWLSSLNRADRANFLAGLSHNLTLAVRVLCHCDASATEALDAIREVNESHHNVAGYLLHMQDGSEDIEWLPLVAKIAIDLQGKVARTEAQLAWQSARASIEADRAG